MVSSVGFVTLGGEFCFGRGVDAVLLTVAVVVDDAELCFGKTRTTAPGPVEISRLYY